MMNKDTILREIRRTAAENGGLPVGSRKFAQLTDIHPADWSGKLWARWGDALQEAGFAGNWGAFQLPTISDFAVALTRAIQTQRCLNALVQRLS
jgi:hypothetical protein